MLECDSLDGDTADEPHRLTRAITDGGRKTSSMVGARRKRQAVETETGGLELRRPPPGPKRKRELSGNPLIYVEAAYYGESEADSCQHADSDWCVKSVLTSPHITDCMAEHECYIEPENQYLSRCDDLPDYLQVEYRCLPGE